jgi:hypothetical protein
MNWDMTEQPLTPRAVFVAWRDPIEHRCYPVARLARLGLDNGAGPLGFEFVYTRSSIEARSKGFCPIASFDQFERVYQSPTLFPFFANRLMSNERPEYPAFLERVMLRVDHADPFEVLSRTGGIRATDSFEVFPLPRFEPSLPGFRTLFLVHALRHFPRASHERILRLQPDERLRLMLDYQNDFDPGALALRTDDRVLVGHVPSYLLLETYTLAGQCGHVDITVAKVSGPPAPLDQRLLCMMESCWPPEYRPFVDERFRPIAAGAIDTAVLIGDPRGLTEALR